MRQHRLNAVDVAKLRLAGRGDIKRFFDLVEQKRREFNSVRMDLIQGQRFLLHVSVPIRDPFGGEAIFSKTLNRIIAQKREDIRPPD